MSEIILPDNPTLRDTKNFVAKLVSAVVNGAIEHEDAREAVRLTNQMVRIHDQELQRGKFILSAKIRGEEGSAQKSLEGESEKKRK
ncbi:hypothetical protein LCGC14_0517180 [marine sediment metagenome]|uniref:Uncharacterized protein n=1 Tax=marine sediment metagenome TaxID=412755 RepID=A0A0F9S4G8_9ZZZZ